jgi:serine/threonine protein kinase
VHVISEALKGLDYAHRRLDDAGHPLEIVHRDVSPSNLLVSFEGEVKVCDFGIARANDAIDGREGLELEEALKGKAGYMSPEHARGAPDRRARGRLRRRASSSGSWQPAAGSTKSSRGGPTLLDQARQG